jgi:hypothetical protein
MGVGAGVSEFSSFVDDDGVGATSDRMGVTMGPGVDGAECDDGGLEMANGLPDDDDDEGLEEARAGGSGTAATGSSAGASDSGGCSGRRTYSLRSYLSRIHRSTTGTLHVTSARKCRRDTASERGRK